MEIKINILILWGILFLCSIATLLLSGIITNYRKMKKRMTLTEFGPGIKLEPCPFCGNSYQQVVVGKDKDGKELYSIICDTRQGGCGGSTGYFEAPIDAVIAWNTREE